jgi:hypothetical protein
VKTQPDTAERERAREQFAQKLKNGMPRLRRSLTIRDNETI